MRSMVWLVAGLENVVLNVLTNQVLADLMLVSVAMQERKGKAPPGPWGLWARPPPKKGSGAGGDPGQGSSGVGVAGPEVVVSGSPRRKLRPEKHTRCASGVLGKGTLANEKTARPSFVGKG